MSVESGDDGCVGEGGGVGVGGRWEGRRGPLVVVGVDEVRGPRETLPFGVGMVCFDWREGGGCWAPWFSIGVVSRWAFVESFRNRCQRLALTAR